MQKAAAIILLLLLAGCTQTSKAPQQPKSGLDATEPNEPAAQNPRPPNEVAQQVPTLRQNIVQPQENPVAAQNTKPSDNAPTQPAVPEQNNAQSPENPVVLQSSVSARIENTSVGGEIKSDQNWAGEILVTESVSVAKAATLTIEPGAVVRFRHNRDYKNPAKLGLYVEGTLKAVGTPEKQVFFTSDAAEPQNGDWHMIRLEGKTHSEIMYAVIEFAQQGVNMWQSDAVISHSIVRWSNWEGLYAESYSTPVIEYNRVYQNGYNGMAMEQFNDAIVRYNLFEKSGTHGLHIDVSKALVEHNILRGNGAAGLSLDDASTVTANSNTIQDNAATGIMCGEGDNKISARGNYISQPGEKTNCRQEVFTENSEGSWPVEIGFGYPDTKKFDLGYTPGDQEKDKYSYVYSDDETRKILKKIGTGLGLTWSIALEGKYVWTSTVGGDVYKLDPESGEVLRHFKAPSVQPWGMAFDGTRLWITDFAEKRTYSLDPQTGKELSSFNNPDQEHGAKGLDWHDGYLYIMGWTTNTIYKVDAAGKEAGEIKLDYGADGGLTWDGKSFWVPCNGICRFSQDGRLIGKIYSASEGQWDLSWEPADNKFGGYLWATQRTNENWPDEKIFKLEILDDQAAVRAG